VQAIQPYRQLTGATIEQGRAAVARAAAGTRSAGTFGCCVPRRLPGKIGYVRIVTEERLSAILSSLPGSPRVVAGGNFSTPWHALGVLDASIAEYRLFMLNAQPGVPDREGVTLESPFVGAGMRGSPRLNYYPGRLSLVPVLLRDNLRPDVVLVQAAPPVNGTLSLGTEVNILPAAIDTARSRGGLVIAQINRDVPFTSGDAIVHLSDVDYAIEADEPLPSPVHRPPSDVSELIGERVAALVPDEATLQLGIGAVPDAVLAKLTGRRRLRVWSEMFSDGVLDLARAGALDPDHVITASFAFGGPELYKWMDGNPGIRMARTETTNDPALIARQKHMTSVNSALQVDLFAQANAARIRGHVYSGFGGQTDFVVGALHSAGGRAIIALPSWHAKADVSTVVPLLDAPATSFQHSYLVSDQGAAEIWGNDTDTQARQIVSQVAHPSAREELRAAGRELGFRI
jgi:acyl-CoA hydrolase